MRVLAIGLILIVTVIQLLLGVTNILGSSYRSGLAPRPAAPEAALLPNQLGQAPAPPPARAFTAGSSALLLLGVLSLALVIVGSVAVALLGRRRAPFFTLGLLGAGLVGLLIQVLAAPDGRTLNLIGLALLAVALGAAALSRGRRPAAPTAAP